MNRSFGRFRRVMAIAHHEHRAAVRSKVLVALLVIMTVVTVVSVYIASADYHSQLADYLRYRAAAQASGVQRIPPPPLQLLSLLRGAMEYIEIIGAVIAIALGYLVIARERASRTTALVRSRPVSARELAAGTLAGSLMVIGTLLLVTAGIAVICLGVIGHDWPTGDQWLKLLLAYFAALLYMGVFFCLGVVVTSRSRVAANGLMIALGLWLVVVLVLPQIGDTLDADNQVPGGLFSALALTKPQELQVMSHFGTYEFVRNAVEEASISKHFERFAFAMTDVQDKYRGFSVGRLIDEKRNDVLWLLAYAVVFVLAIQASYRKQSVIPEGGNT